MSTMTCALVVDRAAIPAASDVVRHLEARGHTVAFPRGFEFADDGRDSWVPIRLDGAKTGFDCTLTPVEAWADEDAETAARLAGVGSHLLEFGARGQDSVRALTPVLRALCALSGASGWAEEEIIPPGGMPDFLDGVEQSGKALEAAASAPMTRRSTAPAPRRNPLTMALWIALYAAVALGGWFLATS